MSVRSHLEKAEDAIRQALINALAEGEDAYLNELFEKYNSVRDLRKKVSNTIRFSDQTNQFYDNLNDDISFNLTDPDISGGTYPTTKIGKDLDLMDGSLNFDNINLSTSGSADVISFGDFKDSKED
tara:strand:- start:7769 stop:8146 length:378 start_codon:yes stop_codon:yes gene_type:complete